MQHRRNRRPAGAARRGRVATRRVEGEVARAARALGLAGERVLAAVSGGLDSTVLARALAATAARGGFSLCLGHVHHGLRGAEADGDQTAVRELAGRLGVSFGAERVDPHRLREATSSRDRPTLQEAARTARYRALEALAQRLGATRIATAHHADDQVETVLLRLLRGSGPDGLGGIPEASPDGRRVRPLLRLTRAELAAYAREQGLRWREDASNARTEYARNRLRRRWLPGLARDFNPRLLRAVADLAEAQRRDSEWIRECVEREARARFAREGAWLRIDVASWDGLPPALARRLVREALRRAGAARHVERVHLERMLGFLASGVRGRRLELPGGLTLCRDGGGFRLGPLPADGPGGGETVC